ncbi:MAG: PsbP-related protein [Candidatus Bathyarchaeia archaeon]
MSVKSRSAEMRSYLFIVVVLLIGSLVAAFILFYFLNSYAQIQNKGISIGGAAAGFVIFFLLLRDTYFKVTSTERSFEGKSSEEQIELLQAKIDQLEMSKLDNFTVPKGYKPEVSEEFNFGFCYPQDWTLSRPRTVLYGIAIDNKATQKPEFNRNLNVNIDQLSNIKSDSDLDDAFQTSLECALSVNPTSKLIFKETFLLNGLPATRWKIDYEGKDGRMLTCYQILVADKNRRNIFTISFTCSRETFDSSRALFDNIVSTFRV